MRKGEWFDCFGFKWVCLDMIDGDCLAMMTKPWKVTLFDKDNNNDWYISSLRRTLNSEFLSLLYRRALVVQTADLVADNGDDSYGTCYDYVTILSCDQYRKYRKIIPLFDERMWTLTPVCCKKNKGNVSYAFDSVRVIDDRGVIGSISANFNGNGVAPVILLSAEFLKSCEENSVKFIRNS